MQQMISATPAKAGCENSRPLFILTIRNSPDTEKRASINYEFWLSDNKRPSLLAGNERIVSIRRVPRAFSSLSVLLEMPNKDPYELSQHERQIGYIEYKTSDTLARTHNYHPKEDATWVSSLGYFLESIATYDLRNFGIKMVSTTDNPSSKRISRLKQVGLPVNTPININEWIAGLSRGVHMRIDKLHKQVRQKFAA